MYVLSCIRADITQVIWLIVFFLINSLAFGITAVPRMNLIVSLICRQALGTDTTTNPYPPVVIGGYNPQCMVGDISSLTAKVASYGNIISGLLAIMTSTFLNTLSDRVGRVRIIFINTVGLVGAELVLVVLANSSNNVSSNWLFLAYFMDGLSGSFAVSMSMASAYISDCTAEEKRNVQIGRIHGSMFIGIAVGPIISSFIVSLSGQKTPLTVFYVCLVMRGISLVYLYFVPESLPKAGTLPPLRMQSSYASIGSRLSRSTLGLPTGIDRLNPSKWLDRLVPPGFPESSLFRRNVVFLLLINIICYSAAMSTAEVLILYPQIVFKWGNVENNTFMSVINFFRAAVSALALPVLIRLFRKPSQRPNLSQSQLVDAPTGADSLDRTLMRTAILCDIFGFVGYATSPNGVLFTLCGALAAFGAIGLSTTEAALTKHISRERVGELMGGLGLMQAIVRIVAPSTANMVYSWTVTSAPGLAFLGVAGTLCIGVLLTLFLRVDINGM
ncbi:MFS general substrate transporter [Saccharata proteae CBS 121410]|uniref:MFS general substrate transporter n=1 Tax=Saccharata proteae CBS 121410 TaxID=1314787 RepID=A0A9P4HVF8_9PEZI|nr:MFS general substrate transporter [Saccharata proteae CBS 121410]